MPDHSPPQTPPPTPPQAPATTAGPGAAARALRLARTVLAGTFTPRDFLADWERQPARWASPLELLSVSGLLVGAAVHLGHVLGLTVEGDRHVAGAVAASQVAAAAVDGFNSLLPVASVWSQVLALRVGAALACGVGGWRRAVRLSGFMAAYYVPASLLSLAVGAVAGVQSLPFYGVTAATVALEAAYSWLGFRRLYGLPVVRALVGTVVGLVLALLLEQLFAVVALAGALVLGARFPG